MKVILRTSLKIEWHMEEASSDKNIDLYLSGKLSDVEKEAFEKKLDMDESLKKELELALQAKLALYALGIEEQKESFNSRWEAVKEEHKPRTQSLYYLLAAAAVMGLLLLFNFLRPAPQLSNQELFAQYYETPLAPSIRAEGSESSFKQANVAFLQERYAEAITLYQRALADSAFTEREEALFFLGASHLELNQGEKALELFEQLSSEEYVELKNWYSVLAYLQLDRREQAQIKLEEIRRNPQHFYHKKAEAILDHFK